jgi:hypothetical protein
VRCWPCAPWARSARAAASLPALGWLATGFLAGGTVLALIALACVVVPVRLATTARADGGPPGREH